MTTITNDNFRIAIGARTIAREIRDFGNTNALTAIIYAADLRDPKIESKLG
jgi:hypothetical protein